MTSSGTPKVVMALLGLQLVQCEFFPGSFPFIDLFFFFVDTLLVFITMVLVFRWLPSYSLLEIFSC